MCKTISLPVLERFSAWVCDRTHKGDNGMQGRVKHGA